MIFLGDYTYNCTSVDQEIHGKQKSKLQICT